jgi:hypothetical protein
MPHTFKYYQHKMVKNSSLKITRAKWHSKEHYIYWDEMRNAYAEHKEKGPDMEWYWDDYRTAYEDLTSSDWSEV